VSIGVETKPFREGLHGLHFHLSAETLRQWVNRLSTMDTQCLRGRERFTTEATICDWIMLVARLATLMLRQSPTLFMERLVFVGTDDKATIEAPEWKQQTRPGSVFRNVSV
jgi:hypothetical protein